MSVSHWERGARIPSENILVKLSDILKVDFHTLDQELIKYFEWRKRELKKQLGMDAR
ncbi:MAG: helix-turn-helix domain-containing protein [bacterium]